MNEYNILACVSSIKLFLHGKNNWGEVTFREAYRDAVVLPQRMAGSDSITNDEFREALKRAGWTRSWRWASGEWYHFTGVPETTTPSEAPMEDWERELLAL